MSLDLAVRERSGWIEGGGEGPVTERRWRYSGRGRSHSKWGGGKRRRDKGWRVGNAFFYLFKLKLICNQKKNSNLITSAEPLLASICERFMMGDEGGRECKER